jgi:hypothetical protein
MGVVRVVHYGFLRFSQRGVLSVGDGKWVREAPTDGQILGYTGTLGTIGSAGSAYTELQVRNSSVTPDRDYFTTTPKVYRAATSHVFSGGVLGNYIAFRRGELLELDIDTSPDDAADLEFDLYCAFFREVEV